MSRSQALSDQIRSARLYTKDLLKATSQDQWFQMPSEGVTHVAWQVGHLAVSQYYLGLFHVRGASDEDNSLLPTDFGTLFGKDSVPSANAGDYPSASEIVLVLDAVHARVKDEIAAVDESTWDTPTEGPEHPFFKTKWHSASFVPAHEFLHAGQIGLLRRLLGEKSLR